jgi:hypothetical protein
VTRLRHAYQKLLAKSALLSLQINGVRDVVYKPTVNIILSAALRQLLPVQQPQQPQQQKQYSSSIPWFYIFFGA